MAAPDSIQQLVKRFEEHRLSYLSGKYNEAQLRQEFLNPFFEALGWDIFNKQSYAEVYKEVIHEASQEKEMIQREIESTDQAIDTLVYQLYGLTEEEIKIVEGRG